MVLIDVEGVYILFIELLSFLTDFSRHLVFFRELSNLRPNPRQRICHHILDSSAIAYLNVVPELR